MYYKLEHMIYKYNSNLSNYFKLNLHSYASDFSTSNSEHLRVTFFQDFRLWGHCIHLCQSENGLSITWLMKTMLNKVCFIAKTKIPYHVGYQMICVKK